MTSWNLEELRTLVKDKYGDDQRRVLNPHMESVDWKLRIAAYHSYAFSETFAPFFSGAGSPEIKAVNLILSTGEEASRFRDAKLIAESNIIACAQSTHSVSDILSHVIVHALKIDSIDVNRASIGEVKKWLPNGVLREKITELLNSQEYIYLKDFVNTTKHISLVFSSYDVDLKPNSDKSHGIKFKAFEYRNRRHEGKWAEDFVKELRKLSMEYVRIGKALNCALRSRVT